MTNEEAVSMIEAKLECLERRTTVSDIMCNVIDCDNCKLNYAQGNVGEQREWLRMAINSLKAWEEVKAKIRKGKFAEKKGLSERSLIYANGWEDGLEVAISIIDKYLRQEIEE